MTAERLSRTPAGWRAATAAALAAMSLVTTTGSASPALPRPRAEEWWFPAWHLTGDVWRTARGQGVTVAVIDGGVRSSLPELDGVVLKEKSWPGAGAGSAGGGPPRGEGTAVAALIAAQGRGSGMAGVAPEARILPLRAAGASLGPALRYAADHGAKVITVSHAGRGHCDAGLQRDVEYAVRRDAVIVAAAGDGTAAGGDAPWAAGCAGVLGVGAVDDRFGIGRASPAGANVMAAAPGAGTPSVHEDGSFRTSGEASAATALASGAVALVRSRFPRMSGRQVVQRMLATAKDVGPPGWDDRSGYGVLLPAAAITTDVPADAPNPTYERLDHWGSGQRGTYGAPTPAPTAEGHARGNESAGPPLLIAALSVVAVLTVGALFVLRKRAAGR